MAADPIWPALVLIPTLALATLTDLRDRTVPDRLNLAAASLALGLGLALDPASVPARGAAGAAAAAALGALAWARPQGMGMGDAKLAGVLGLCLGEQVVIAVLAALLAGNLVVVARLVRQGRAARKSTLPFGPCLAAGAVVGVVAQAVM